MKLYETYKAVQVVVSLAGNVTYHSLSSSSTPSRAAIATKIISNFNFRILTLPSHHIQLQDNKTVAPE